MKKLLTLALSLALTAAVGVASANTKLVVGASATPHAEILEAAKPILAEKGIDLEIVVFDDYVQPNLQLEAGDLDANYFQHIPYLTDYNKDLPEDKQLVAAIPVHYEPYCIYAGKTASIDELKEGATIAVTNDPANETRALLLLQEAGIIKLPEDATVNSSLTAFDVVENPLKINLLEIDASQLPSTLQDVDMAVINGNFALDAGLSPAKDAIFMEAADSEAGEVYTNYVVVRPEDKDAAWVEALRSCLQSQKIYDFILNNEDYKGGVIPAFTVEEKAE